MVACSFCFMEYSERCVSYLGLMKIMLMKTKRLLTKSRFKLGLECPNKLFYTNKDEYANTNIDDSFLKALAQGGFQVEELSRLEYPNGYLIEGDGWNYDLLVEQTNKLLKRDNVVIYEAAFKSGDLFVRTDILVKKGNDIELIEVKAKSYDPLDKNIFIGKKGGLVSTWKPYLFDIAFQHHVVQLSRPSWNIKSYLLMANKRREAKVDGLNQCFRISKKSENRTGVDRKINSIVEIGESILGRIEISDIVSDIQSGKHKYLPELNFLECVDSFSKHYSLDKKYNYPVTFSSCKSCEYRTTKEQEDVGLLSGFKECWSEQKGLIDSDFKRPKIFEIWNFRGGKNLFENEGKIFLDQLERADLKIKYKNGEMTQSERQWIQVEKRVKQDKSPYILVEELKEVMESWKYPLHFIDFETSTVALPFHKGRSAYEQIAFQFSHHILHENDKVEHHSEYINFTPGHFPNFEFIRTLRNSLSNDEGTIFKFATHENTIVNAIWEQLNDSDEYDKKELQEFIESISHSKRDSVKKWKGERDMVDMCEIVKKYYYNPLTNGSNSIKHVLPASLNSSRYLKNKYSKPLGIIGVSSLNFDRSHIWLTEKDGEIISPYKGLPQLFDNWTVEQLETLVSEIEGIDNGGAALTAYGRLQYTDMSKEERLELKSGLLKYCELDTLAMVMIYEHLRELVNEKDMLE